MKQTEVDALNKIISDDLKARIKKLEDEFYELTERHKEAKRGLPRQSKTIAWSIWLLQGASLTLLNQAINGVKNKSSMIQLMMSMRLQFEITEQVKYFRSLPRGSRSRVTRWFNRADKHLFYGGNKPEYGEFKLNGMNPSWDNNSKTLNQYLSSYTHATFDMARSIFQYDNKKGSLEYYSLDQVEHNQRLTLTVAEHYLHFTKAAFDIE